ncbi:MAG: adenylosuccinate lyase [Chloroflexi bacterium]|nr:adenylosuccinate lyase [Chloroflexota bacterium]
MRSSLHAISPVDGRYSGKTAPLQAYLSEWALMKYRLRVEIRWLIALSENDAISHLRRFTRAERELLKNLVDSFDDDAAGRIKAIEAQTNHDVKAVEYYVRERLQGTSLSESAASVHFACTSDDINNLAYAMMIRDVMHEVWQPAARDLLRKLKTFSRESAAIPMLGRTHGQPASPTTLGKEIAVFVHRLQRQLQTIESQEYLGKFNGAVGAYNAHCLAYPELAWPDFSRRFVESLGLTFNPLTTQIESHDYLAELAHSLMRFNTVSLDCCRDMWAYISLGAFRQRARTQEVGSSTMPHKVNPIDFENAEANLGISNANFAHLADKLPISRLQRDLSDSSALRNYGVAIAHGYLALISVRRGLTKLEVDHGALGDELENNWQVLAEAVQTVLRKHHVNDAYEQLKDLTRGKKTTQEELREFIRQLDIPAEEKARLLQLNPGSYIGFAEELALSVTKES